MKARRKIISPIDTCPGKRTKLINKNQKNRREDKENKKIKE